MRHNPMFPPRSLAMLFSSSARLLYGAIRLTEAREYQMGSLTLRPTAPLPAVRDFVASFDVLIGGGEADAHDPARLGWWERGGEPLAGHGVSFCYADLSSAASSGEAFGERGPKGEHALCVSLLTHSSRLLEVTRGGEVRADRRGPQPLRTVTPPDPHPGGRAYPSPSDPPYAPLPPWHHHHPLAPPPPPCTTHTPCTPSPSKVLARVRLGSELRIFSWVEMRVEMRATASSVVHPPTTSLLSVWYDGVSRLHQLPVPSWAPTPGWSWGWGASTRQV